MRHIMKRERINEYYKTYAKEDLNAVSPFYSDDVVFEFQGQTYNGKEVVFAWFKELQQTFHEVINPLEIVIDGDKVAIEIESEFEARVDLPDFHGKALTKGDKTKIRFAVFYDTRDDQFCHIRLYTA